MKAFLLCCVLCLLLWASTRAGGPEPRGYRREYRQHHQRAQRVRHHRVRQTSLPHSNPQWRQKNP